MKSLDATEGGEPINTSIIDTKGKITAELLLKAGTPDEPITIQVVGKGKQHGCCAEFCKPDA
jgi:hypothetical protein